MLLLLSTFFALTISGCNHKEPAPVEEPDVPGIHNVQDFLAFASAVNTGASTKEWENEEGWVNLLADLDFAGVTDFKPVEADEVRVTILATNGSPDAKVFEVRVY